MNAAAPLPHASHGWPAVQRALREAIVAMLAALAALACTLAIAPGRGPAVLAVVLAISLSRSHLDHDRRQRLESALALPVVGLAAVGVGALLRHAPWIGAAVFVAGLFASIWLRRFGATARRLGSLIALPFVTLLVVPHVAGASPGPVPPALLPIVVALLALFWVGALHALAWKIGVLPRPRSADVAPARERRDAERTGGLKPDAATRMALQMAVGLAAAFVVGYVGFGERWAWIVLTAYIVQSGNRGRLDVAYKSVLRVVGAAAGTVLALAADVHVGAHDAGTAALILVALFLGVWLRPITYVAWALFVTVALALLQGFADEPPSHVLPLRLEEIVIGALIGVAAAWYVLPVRSTGVLRRRLADALAALSAALDPAAPVRSSSAFAAAVDALVPLAPAFRAARLVTRRWRAVQPADWIDAVVASRTRAIALIERGGAPADVRRAVGAARKALLEPATLTTALRTLRDALERPPAE
ncbi:MAG TPA: FUSC family protein [Dokdonella sp.]